MFGHMEIRKMNPTPDPMVLKKHELIRQLDRKEIDVQTFNERMADVRKAIDDNMNKVVNNE